MRILMVTCLATLLLGCSNEADSTTKEATANVSEEPVKLADCPFDLKSVLAQVGRSGVRDPEPLGWFRRENLDGSLDGVVIMGLKNQDYTVIACFRKEKPKGEFEKWTIAEMHVSRTDEYGGFRRGEEIYNSKPTLSQVNNLLESVWWKSSIDNDRNGLLKSYGFKPSDEYPQ